MGGAPGEAREQHERPAPHAQPAGVLVVVDRVGVAGREVAAGAQERRVQLSEAGLALARELGRLERLRVLGIGDLAAAELGERRELAPAALARGGRDVLVDVVGEELERRLLAVLVALEDHRRERRQQRAQRGQRLGLGRQPLAERAVADLVVVGGEDHEALRRDLLGGGAEAAAPERRVGPVVHVRAVERLGEVGDGAELRVVALAVAGQQHAQGVVEVVGPGGVAAPQRHHLRVVEARLGDHQARHPARDRRHEVLGARVLDRMDGVEPQPVDVEVAHPLLGALDRPFPDRAGVRPVVVDRVAPGGGVLRGEVRAEGGQRLGAGGADVVVDDVEDHGQAGGVGGVDEPLEPLRAAVGGLRGRHVDAVVAPAAAARELGHRHQLDRGDAELAQPGQVRDRRLERALGRERADVQLVQHQVAQARAAPSRRRSIRTRQDRAAATARGARPAASGCTGRASPRRRPRTRSRRPAEPPRGPRRRRSRRRRARGRARRCAATARGRAGPTRAAPRGRRRARRRRGGARRAGRHQARGPHLPGNHGVQSRPCGCCSPPCSSAPPSSPPPPARPRTSRATGATLNGTVDESTRSVYFQYGTTTDVRPHHAHGRTSRRGRTGAGHGPDGRDDVSLPARGRRRGAGQRPDVHDDRQPAAAGDRQPAFARDHAGRRDRRPPR